jgi:phage major head subunit gpT-like protein
VTRQALINDDLGAFDSLVRRFGVSAAEREAAVLVGLITANAAMGDGVALFHATHGNLAASGGAISDVTLGAARLAMRQQKGLDGKTPINARPAFLLVPAALETVAQKYLATIYAATAATVNPFAGSNLELLVDPRLDTASATAWYVAADPAVIDGIEYAYLEGQPGPQIEQRIGFDIEGVDLKCRLDFGAGILDHRGLYRNAGA